MKKTRFQISFPLTALVAGSALLPVLAHAHPGHLHAGDFQSGFLHPLSGIDHLLALLAVGMCAIRLGGAGRWVMPLAALGALAVGSWAGGVASSSGVLEFMVVASLLVLGAFVGLARRTSTTMALSAVAGFMLFHGMAHGAEIAVGTGATAASQAGLLLASTGVLSLGLIAGSAFEAAGPARARRLFAASGTMITLCGILCALL